MVSSSDMGGSNKDTFLSIENMKVCQGVFEKYMTDQYSFNVQIDGSKTNLKKLLFDVMQDVNSQYINSPQTNLKDMNNITLNVARDFYTTHYKLQRVQQVNPHARNDDRNLEHKPMIQKLERDKNVYGPRHVSFEQIKPVGTAHTSQDADDVNKAYAQLEGTRKEERTRVLQTPDEIRPTTETALEPLDFMQRMSELEKKREDMEVRDLTAVNERRRYQDSTMMPSMNFQNINPKDLYEMSSAKNLSAEKQRQSYETSNHTIPRSDLLAPPVGQQILVDKFLSINGFDRQWLMDPSRFKFRVDFNFNENSLQNRYRNIKSIKATRVIIPMEIEEHRSLINVPKTTFNYEFALSYPYLLLNVDEFTDVYDGTNENARACFCHLVFDKCYKAKNGRGYIVLNTMQGERKVFHPTPLSGLTKMSLSLRKPNGELLNKSKDAYKIFKVEYDLYNRQYFKIITDTYFDRNEFFKGDTILVQGFDITNCTAGMTDEGVLHLNTFVNRKEGHEIVEIGQPNDSGFFRNFYIYGPGEFDNQSGTFVLDDVQVSNLNHFNDTINYSTWTGTNGSILNSSLQCTVTFKLQVVSSDPGIVDTSYYTTNVFE